MPALPDFSARTGDIRYVNFLRDDNGAVVTSCLGSPASLTFYQCATVGCEPEFANWALLFGGEVIQVSGSAIVPDSTFSVAQLPVSCTGNEALCAAASSELDLATARHGDVNDSGAVGVADVVLTVDAVKDIVGAVWEFQSYVRRESPEPQNESANVTDIVSHVDALKLFAYPFTLPSCP